MAALKVFHLFCFVFLLLLTTFVVLLPQKFLFLKSPTSQTSGKMKHIALSRCRDLILWEKPNLVPPASIIEDYIWSLGFRENVDFGGFILIWDRVQHLTSQSSLHRGDVFFQLYSLMILEEDVEVNLLFGESFASQGLAEMGLLN